MAVRLVRTCLASPSRGVLEGILRLHILVLCSLAVALSFRVTSAEQAPAILQDSNVTLTFDDIQTTKGWAYVPSNYTFLRFDDFHVFKPTAPELENLISKHDLNCAASPPNALYGARALPSKRVPTIEVNDTFEAVNTQRQSFTLHSMKIKPLDMPFAHASINLRGTRRDNGTLSWTVNFPAGFHAMLDVDIASFSGNAWNELRQLEIWSDFHNGYTMDWEFCLDDLEVSLDS